MKRYYIFPIFIRVHVHPSVGYDSNLIYANIVCFLCSQGSPSHDSSVRKKTCHAPNTATPQHKSSLRRFLYALAYLRKGSYDRNYTALRLRRAIRLSGSLCEKSLATNTWIQMDDLQLYVLFNSNSFISGRWEGDNERL